METGQSETARAGYLVEDGIICMPVERWKLRDFLRRWVAEKERLAMQANDLDEWNAHRQALRKLRRTLPNDIKRMAGAVRELGIIVRKDERARQ